MEIEQSTSLDLRLRAAALDTARERLSEVQAAGDQRTPEVVVQLSEAAKQLSDATGG